MSTYRQLFGLGEFRVLFTAQCLSVLAGSAASLGLATTTYAATGSAALAALSMFGGPLVSLLVSALALAASDLVRPRWALTSTAVVVAIANLLQAMPGLPWPARFAILALVWCALAATSGVAVALMTDLLPARDFVLGRATLNLAVGGMQILGFAVGGLVLAATSSSTLFLAAAASSALAAVLIRTRLSDHPARATGAVVTRSLEVNKRLLASPVLRPLYLSSWVPNGMIVGCEALYVPYAGAHAGTCSRPPRSGCSSATSWSEGSPRRRSATAS